MAYTLKPVVYKNIERHILLQNENGPCPLLAAANALLLQGDLTFPPHVIRQNVASIDDLVNILAERALKSDGGSSTHHVDELLELFPTLQYGMDVNPKFTMGPTGCEYTTGLSAFDLMGVELVHGWLIDVQEVEFGQVIGSKTYNELAELMIKGNDASAEIQKIEVKILQLESQIRGLESGWVDEEKEEAEDGAPTTSTEEGKSIKEDETAAIAESAQSAEIKAADIDEPDSIVGKDTNDEKEHAAVTSMRVELDKLQKDLEAQTQIFKDGTVVESFLSTSSTQLTYAGLTELNMHVEEGKLYVFFRNNHFATLTKHDGTLYLLVTDLGYKFIPEVMWEKLDDISGDTEYADQNFLKPKPRENNAAVGSSLSPEQLLAQSNVKEADFQLALQLSRNENAIDEEESKLIAAAKEASLHAYKNEKNGFTAEGSHANDSLRSEEASLAAAREAEDRIAAMQLQAQLQEADAREDAQRRTAARQKKQKAEGGCAIS